jgi:uncharacterized membrane protein YidH (DUF202 family)
MNIYYYLFYKIYRFTQKLGNYDVAFSAVFGLSFLLGLNFLVIFIKLFPATLENLNEYQYKIPLLIFFAAILISNYFLFVFKKRYEDIEKQFINESKRKKRIGNFIVVAYVIISLLLVPLLL